MEKLSNPIKQFWQRHDQKILISLALILTAIVSFQAGKTAQKSQQTAKIDVNLAQKEPVYAQTKASNSSSTSDKNVPLVAGNKDQNLDKKTTNPSQECAFVGSKNSNKYHLPNCKYAAKITGANRVCFKSKEDAESKGYEPAKCCIK